MKLLSDRPLERPLLVELGEISVALQFLLLAHFVHLIEFEARRLVQFAHALQLKLHALQTHLCFVDLSSEQSFPHIQLRNVFAVNLFAMCALRRQCLDLVIPLHLPCQHACHRYVQLWQRRLVHQQHVEVSVCNVVVSHQNVNLCLQRRQQRDVLARRRPVIVLLRKLIHVALHDLVVVAAAKHRLHILVLPTHHLAVRLFDATPLLLFLLRRVLCSLRSSHLTHVHHRLCVLFVFFVSDRLFVCFPCLHWSGRQCFAASRFRFVHRCHRR
mmetsp:Transcript_46885/g.75016  ORF Transcript_46885/g.75016 Transcript_46885/m.75016 type:complete len:271 (-) Transcript_46885:886-1698(-)